SAGSFEALAETVRFSATEREVVARYVLGPTKVSLLTVARSLNRSLITVVVALRSAGNKLEGKEGRHHLKDKYWRMFDHELEDAIKCIGPKSRRDLSRTNQPLYSVALARGICDRILPVSVGRVLVRLRIFAEKRLKGESLEAVCKGLSPLEVGILIMR